MWAQIGPIVIEIITWVEELDGQHGHDYPQHEVIEGKPLLQWIGGKLSSYRFKYHLHCGMIMSPRQQFEFLKKVMDEHKALPFLKGNGTYMGTYVITDLTDDYRFETDRGGVIEMGGEMSLLEFVFENAQQELDAKAAAQRTSVMSPGLPNQVPTVSTRPEDNSNLLVQAIRDVEQGTSTVQTQIVNGNGGPTAFASLGQVAGGVTSPFNAIMAIIGNATGDLTTIAGSVNQNTATPVEQPQVTVRTADVNALIEVAQEAVTQIVNRARNTPNMGAIATRQGV